MRSSAATGGAAQRQAGSVNSPTPTPTQSRQIVDIAETFRSEVASTTPDWMAVAGVAVDWLRAHAPDEPVRA